MFLTVSDFWYSLVKCNIDVLLGSVTFWRRHFRAGVLGPTFLHWDVLAPRRFGTVRFWRRSFSAEMDGAEMFWPWEVLAP